MIDLSDPEVIESLKYLLIPKEERIRLSALPFDAKKNVFITDKHDGYVTAIIEKEEGDNVTVKTVEKGMQVTVKKDQVLQMNPPKYEKCDDMADLTYLNDATVYHNLRERYTNWYIYTYSGLFCVTINPFKRLPLYTMKMVHFYRGKKKNEVPPHLYLVADNAYSDMCRDRANQSMLITGESGAGKTENTKKVIQYFAFVAANVGGKKAAAEDANKPSLEDQIVSANPVLEAYGNAKTTRNNNSSRFGKFIRIHFTNKFAIAGADIESYLLEKSRITYCMELERNYHIFYQLCSPAFPELQKEIMLEPDAGKYFFINQGKLTIDKVDDAQEMRDTKKAFDILMFTQEQQMDLFKCTSAVANWGNTKWKQRPREEQAEPDGTEELGIVARLLGIDEEELIKGLTKPRIKVGNEFVNKGQNKDQCTNSVGALSKAIFSRCFTWLVEVVNVTLDVKELKRAHFIGVLDIAGFETFEYNGFEQLCINFTNECLQQFFNNFMFVLEQAEYAKEGIVWETMPFGADLQATIDLISKPMGIFSMLEEECVVPKGTDMTYKEKMYKQHLGKHPAFGKPKPKKGAKFEAHFDLHHYAGVVSYSVDGWLEKNKDPINMTVAALFKASKGNQLLSQLFQDIGVEEAAGKKSKSGSQNTISAGHREQLNKLMKTLDATNPHFVRCIIPNEIKTGGILDAHLVLHQLHCNGVLEGIRICRKGYPSRVTYAEFLHRYGILAAEAFKSNAANPKQACTAVLAEVKLDSELYRVGMSKVLFKAGVLGTLEEMRDAVITKIMTLLQSQMRRYLIKKNIKKMLEQKIALGVIQRNVKASVDLRNWQWLKLFNSMKHLLTAAKKAEEERIAREEAEREAARQKELERIENERRAAMAKELEATNAKLVEEQAKMSSELKELKELAGNSVETIAKMSKEKAEIESQVSDLEDKLSSEEKKAHALAVAKKKLEEELNDLKSGNDDFSSKLGKAETELKSKDTQISKFKSENAQLEENVSKLSKEKKRLEEANNKTLESLQIEEDKVKNLSKLKSKLEQSLEEAEENAEREKKLKNDLDKARRKLDAELKSAQATIEENEKQKIELEETIKKRESDIKALNDKVEEDNLALNAALKKIKELQASLSEAESETEAERAAKVKVEKQRAELNRQIEDLNGQLEEARDATSAQVELNKKREAELAKLKRDLEEAHAQHESALNALKKKNQDAVNEMAQQIDQLQKLKVKLEKEKTIIKSEVDEVKSQTENIDKAKSASEKAIKQLEQQLQEMKSHLDESNNQAAELAAQKSKLQSENSNLLSQCEDLESQLVGLAKMKQQLNSQIEEAKSLADSESRAKSSLNNQLKNLSSDYDSLKSQLEDEQSEKAVLQKQLTKATSEAQQYKSRLESDGMGKTGDLEEAKKKLANKLAEAESQYEQLLNKFNNMEKARNRLQSELDSVTNSYEKANSSSLSLEKKQKQFEKAANEWKQKYDDVVRDLESANRESNQHLAESAKLKNQNEDLESSLEAARRENRNLNDEIKNLNAQLNDDGRNSHDLLKFKKHLEEDKEELARCLEEAERTIEQEQSKTALAQFELNNLKQEIEKRLRDKEESFENTRRNHQRAIESHEASLEAEQKAKNEAIKQKSKLEQEINDLQVSLEHSVRSYKELQNNNKKLQQQLVDNQSQLQDEQRKSFELSEAVAASERRANSAISELEAARSLIEQADRARKLAENNLQELSDSLNDATSSSSTLLSQKRKLEGELSALQSELSEYVSELKSSEEKSKKALNDVAKLADDLRHEKENLVNSEKAKKSLELVVKDLQNKLEQTEENLQKGGKRALKQLEEKIQELEAELDSEHRRHLETTNQVKKNEKRFKDLIQQAEEEKKNELRLQELVDALQEKNKALKTQVEEAEEIAALNLSKFRKAQHDLEEATNLANEAQNQVSKLKAEKRGSESQDRSSQREYSVSRSYRAGSTAWN